MNSTAPRFAVPSRYTDTKTIGCGASGVVVSALDEEFGRRVAIKKCADAFSHGGLHARRFLREVEILQFVNHPNVMGLTHLPPPHSEEKFDDVYMVMEKMDADLDLVLRTQRLSEDHVAYFMYQLVCALNYLHSAGIVHRDLKPANLLVNASCHLKVTDFGLSRGVVDEPGAMTEYVVTRHYRAPEIMLACKQYGPAIDMWAAGCIFAEMLIPGEVLFPGKDYRQMLRLMVAFLGSPSPDELPARTSARARAFVDSLPASQGTGLSERFLDASPAALDLLRRLLTLDPAERITAAKALQHPYFARLYQEKDNAPAPAKFRSAFEGASTPPLDGDAVRRAVYQLALRADSATAAAATAAVPTKAAAAAGGGGGAAH